MDNNLISVIVPVYNVSEYLEECCRAIISQTYSNLEIILVDDGSTDGSDKICDYYEKLDDRIKVIHKPNGGLSSARNSGLEIASGSYISFIDSDDYPRQEMMEKLVSCFDSYDLDVVCCNYSSTKTPNKLDGRISVLGKNKAISYLLDDGGYRCFAWNKMYRRSMFKNIKYPEGKLFEDIGTTYKIFKISNRVCYINEDLYYYRQRESSITSVNYNSKSKDVIDAINFVLKDSSQILNKDEYSRLTAGYCHYYLSYLKKAMLADEESKEEINYYRKFVLRVLSDVKRSEGISIKEKNEILLFLSSPYTFKKLLKRKNQRKKLWIK